MKLKPKNWHEHQHYKDRSPPWIKLHRKLLNDRDFMMLPIASKALAPLLWLLASESKDATFDASPDELIFRLRITRKDLDGLQPLIDKGFFIVASDALADRQQDAIPEGETETEGETKRETEKMRATRLPADWVLPTAWCEWAEEEKGWSSEKARQVSASFKDYWIAKAGKDGRKMDWFATWRNWVRNQRDQSTIKPVVVKPWFIDGWAAIATKGKEFSLNESDYEHPQEFKSAVFKAAGITAEMVKQAEAMAK